MPITVNNGGVLRTLTKITANNYGVLHPLKKVYANKGGVLREIFAEEVSYKLDWKTTNSNYEIVSTDNDGHYLKFQTYYRYYDTYNQYKNDKSLYCKLTIPTVADVGFVIEEMYGDPYCDKGIKVLDSSNNLCFDGEDEIMQLYPDTYYIYPYACVESIYDWTAVFSVKIDIFL